MATKAQTEGEKCATEGCWNKRPYQRGGFLRLCWKCREHLKKKRDPIAHQYRILRKSAQRRDIPFTITPPEWRWWVKQTGYMEKKGKGKGYMSVGRKNHSRGYSLSNIQMEEYHFNSTKGNEIPGEDLPQNHRRGDYVDEPF